MPLVSSMSIEFNSLFHHVRSPTRALSLHAWHGSNSVVCIS